jgi:5-methylcytosine-specific restriction endonuclease McrA
MPTPRKDKGGNRECCRCKKTKPASEFPLKNKSKPELGTKSYCHLCIREVHRENNHANREILSRRAREYKRRNREKTLNSLKDWHRRNKQKQSEYGKKYRTEHLSFVRELCKAWREENPEKVREHHQRRWARMKNAAGKFTMREFRKLCAKYDNRCLCCGTELSKLEPDHIIPLSRGGSNSIDNIQPLCHHCNVSKYTKTIDYRRRDEKPG